MKLLEPTGTELAGEDAWTRIAQRLHLDLPLLAGLLALGVVSLVVLYSASGQSLDVVLRQAARIGAGFGAAFFIAQIPPATLRRWSPLLFIGGIVLLGAVAVVGDVGKGAQRWLDLGVLRFQPSEILKLALPMALAWYLTDKTLPPSGRQVALILMIIALPVLLVARQPDLGTALLILAAGAFVLFLAGLRWKLILGAAGLAILAAPALWFLMRDYQRRRVLTLLDPERDPLGSGYHIIQSKIAIGSGGIFGKGWLNGSQAKLEFLPERSTDFIFAVLAEEFGLVGILVLLALYGFVLVRGLVIASQAPDTFTRLLGGSIVLSFALYIVVNTGMVVGLLPVVGVPLPLISFGGTSIVTLMAGFGILMAIHTHRRLLQKN